VVSVVVDFRKISISMEVVFRRSKSRKFICPSVSYVGVKDDIVMDLVRLNY
jgi:hypothetical protein